MKKNRTLIASIFLMLFCMMQLLEVHVIDHDHDHAECAICVLSSDDVNKNNYTPPSNVEIPQQIVISISKEVELFYVISYFNSSIDYSLSNKAPPLV